MSNPPGKQRPFPKPAFPISIRRTRSGWRLSQHGTVLSEVLTRPGPTHSVFDVLAAACVSSGPPARDIALLGFGGGGVVAALRALGCAARIHAVDLDATGWKLLAQSRAAWLEPIAWHHADAIDWLRQSGRFDLIIDDLSVPYRGDVAKPEATWNILPNLVRKHLRPRGRALFNLLRPAHGTWAGGIRSIAQRFGPGLMIHLDEFENRILAVGTQVESPPRANPDSGGTVGPGVFNPRTAGAMIRSRLRSLGSRQADRLCVERFPRA
ncbi:MAG: hypothetical protein AB7O66_08015 [Limisphaerales bacterium]